MRPALAVLAAAWCLVLCPPARAEEPVETEAPSPATARIRKRIAEIDKKLAALLEKEMEVRLAVMNARQKAMEAVKSVEDAAKEIAQGRMTKPLRQYQTIMLACVRQFRAYDSQFAALQKNVADLERQRASQELHGQLAALAERIRAKRKTVLEEIATLCERAGDFKTAIDIYAKIRAAMPEEKKAERRALKELIAAAYQRSGDLKNALATYNEVYEALSKRERIAARRLRMTMAEMYEKIGDFRSALLVYRELKENLKPGQALGNLDEKIKRLEEKVGRSP